MLSNNERLIPKWAELLPEGEFISYLPSYEGGKYFDLFGERVYPCVKTGDITYYVYDPVEHGADPDGAYPLLLWIHGATNSFNGRFCISNCGGELFASPEYQRDMGGAYVVVPLANEKKDDKGELVESWSKDYLEPLKGICDEICGSGRVSKRFAMGGSFGGWVTWKLAEKYPDFFDGIIPISTEYVSNDGRLENMARQGVSALVACGKHDETVDFANIEKRLEKLESLGFLCYFPEWVKNGDGGVASLFYGWEMGQHCVINQVQANLIFDDGTPYDTRLPRGVTGWIKDICDK